MLYPLKEFPKCFRPSGFDLERGKGNDRFGGPQLPTGDNEAVAGRQRASMRKTQRP
jgi:hypothetical protein